MTGNKRSEIWDKLKKEKFNAEGVMTCLAGICVYLGDIADELEKLNDNLKSQKLDLKNQKE